MFVHFLRVNVPKAGGSVHIAFMDQESKRAHNAIEVVIAGGGGGLDEDEDEKRSVIRTVELGNSQVCLCVTVS